MQLAQANKVSGTVACCLHLDPPTEPVLCCDQLLEIYRLVTSTDIRLIETADDDDDSGDSYTDIACTTTDGESGKSFNFELAVPDSRVSEIEYLPSDQPSEDLSVPSYLQVRLVSVLMPGTGRVLTFCILPPHRTS
jgi:hypothetical protein